jgi:hypothetical protein
MRIGYFIIIFLFITSCKDDMVWNLSRKSPKDAKLEVSRLIYSNDCSNLAGFQCIASGIGSPSTIFWGTNGSGISGACLKTEGNCKEGSVKFTINSIDEGILRFHFKVGGEVNSLYDAPIISVNSNVVNTAIVSTDKYTTDDLLQINTPAGEWIQMQSEVLRAGNNSIEIKFEGGNAIRSYSIDEIEIWTPKL